MVGIFPCLAVQSLLPWSKTRGYKKQSVLVVDLWMGSGWFLQKLKMPVNVPGKLQGYSSGWPLRGMLGVEGRLLALEFVHGYHQFNGAGSLVIQKSKPGYETKPLGVTEADAWKQGYMFNAVLPHSWVLGPWVTFALLRSPPCLALISSVPLLQLDGCVQAVRHGLQPWETSLGI